jgi:hypothetical protein
MFIFFDYYLFIFSRSLYDKRISQEVSGEDIGDEFAGYVSIDTFIFQSFFYNLQLKSFSSDFPNFRW